MLSLTVPGLRAGLWRRAAPISARFVWKGRPRTPASRQTSCEAGDRRQAPSGASPSRTPPVPPSGPKVPEAGRKGEPLKVLPVELAGKEAWAGVAQVDSGEDTMADLRRTGLLIFGDAVGLLVFAIIGRISHGEVLSLETFSTALPFWIGWYTAAGLLGGYGKSARGEYGLLPAAGTAAKCWAVGQPIGLALRGVIKGYVPPLSFAVVTTVATGVIMIGWRTAFIAKMPSKKLEPEGGRGRGNRRGNAFDFLSLLGSLTKRW